MKKNNRLTKAQREALLQWIAEGLETDEINQRAVKFKPRFKVTRQHVDKYRKSRNVKLNEIKAADETSALTIGLALKENRVDVLRKLADKFIADLMPENDEGHKRWLLQVKGIGGQDNFERIEYYEFNKAEVDSLRGVLDDIAAEVGERLKKPDTDDDKFTAPQVVEIIKTYEEKKRE